MRFLLLIFALWGCSEETKRIPVEFEQPDAPIPPVVPPSKPGFINLSTLEDQILLDLQALESEEERVESRYLVACDFYNAGIVDLSEILDGVNKLMNSISTEQQLSKVTAIGNSACIFRINLDDFAISRTDWKLIELKDLVNFVSKTVRNQNIQFLTQTRRPYIFLSSFATTVLEADALSDNACKTYCTIIDQPVTQADFFASLGVNVQREYNEERALYEANATSLIALGKTRGYQILETREGWAFTSFDSSLAQPVNHFEFPFTPEMASADGILRSKRVFKDQARETFFSLRNGFYGVRLEGADGLAVANAPNNIVVDTLNAKIDPTIRLGACFGCHKAAFIPFVGQIAQHVLKNPIFNANEKDLVRVFSDPTEIAATIIKIQTSYAKALQSIGIDSEKPDPIVTRLIQPFREQLDAAKVCSYTLLDTPQCLERLRGTSVSSQAFGNILSGGKIPLAVFIAGFNTFVEEMLLFKDDTL